MAENLPISGLPIASTLTGTEVLPVVQSGTTKQTSVSSILYLPTNNYGLFSQTGSSAPITNTTTETSLIDGGLGTLSVPANGFSVGDSFNIVMAGHISCNSSATLRIRVKTGAVVLGDTGVIALDTSTNRHWRLTVDFTIRSIGAATVASIISGGFFSYVKNSGVNLEGYDFITLENTNFNTTITNTLDVTAQWGAASASDIIYSDVFTLVKTY